MNTLSRQFETIKPTTGKPVYIDQLGHGWYSPIYGAIEIPQEDCVLPKNGEFCIFLCEDSLFCLGQYDAKYDEWSIFGLAYEAPSEPKIYRGVDRITTESLGIVAWQPYMCVDQEVLEDVFDYFQTNYPDLDLE